MILFVAFIDGAPRLDITAMSEADIGPRATKVMHPHTWLTLKREGKVQIRRIRLDVLA